MPAIRRERNAGRQMSSTFRQHDGFDFDDSKTNITMNTTMSISKKEKRRMRRDLFIQKLEPQYALMQQEKQKRKKRLATKSQPLMNVDTLQDALYQDGSSSSFLNSNHDKEPQILSTDIRSTKLTKDALLDFDQQQMEVEMARQKVKQSQQQNRPTPKNRVKSHKGRQNTLRKELEQMKMVYQNDRFQKDPVGSLQQHIKLTAKYL
ncbi:hypothetical protein MIR68_010046 [Amoeboaphelidium protococcarum]|nr:hypothetical protein MIR68_010046 [Amoeboaphelidium protococcarum]